MHLDNRIFFIVITVVSLAGCNRQETKEYTGYSYGDFIYLSHGETEKIEEVLVSKGEWVKKGQALVKMESFTAKNALLLAEKKFRSESTLLKNLQSGERPEELNVVRAQLARASSAARLAKNQLVKYQPLFSKKLISSFEWETIQDDYAQKSAQVNELSHQLSAKQLPARQAQVASQTAIVESAKAEWDKAKWNLQQNIISAPQDAQVYDVIYRTGERPVAGKPVISLLPPDNIKIRFFIPQAKLASFNVGMKMSVMCDNCHQPISGKVNYISPQAEYTPPVIYSTERRDKLMYRAEILLDKGSDNLIKLGQPVRVGAL